MLAGALQQSATAITAPVGGQIISAPVTIRGTIDPAYFSFAELSFGYLKNPTDTWFLIQVISQLPQDDLLAVWNTSVLTDGDYRLRLRVYAPDGSYQDIHVNDLHLRSIMPPTETPTFVETGITEEILESTTTAIPGVTEPPPLSRAVTTTPVLLTPRPLPANPAALAADSVYSILGRGALLTVILFVVLGLFLRLRHP